jgi:hypothetical protein
MNLNRIRFHKNTVISKSLMPELPRGFLRSELGYPREGALAQYRGPDGLHAHEFADRWEIHRDYGDPSTLEGAITHAIRDAPEVAVGALTALAVGKSTYDARKEVSQNSQNAAIEAVKAGALSGLFAWGLTYLLTHLDD